MFLDGKIVEVHGIAKDVTEIKQTEKIISRKKPFFRG